MRFVRSFLGLLMSAMLATAPVFAATSSTDLEKQILVLKHQMEMLVHQNAVQKHRIDRLEHRVARLGGHGSHLPPHTAVAASAPAPPQPAPPAAPVQADPQQTVAESVPAAQTAAAQSGYVGTKAPQQGSVQSVYQEQNALFTKGLTITPGVTYTYGDDRFFTLNGFMALGAIFLGNINVSRQQNTVVTPTMNLTYAPNKRLQFDATVPFVYRSSTYSSAGAQGSSQTVSQRTIKTGRIGDINTGFFYQLPQRRLNGPVWVINGHVTIPSGSTPYGIKVVQDTRNNNLSYATTLPTGIGVWTVSAGASVIKTVDPAVLFAGANVYYPIQKHFQDISPYQNTVTPGQVAPGSALSMSVGTAFSLNDRMSATFSFQDTIVGSERLHADGGPWQTVDGSSMNAGVFNIGTTYAINRHTSWQALLGIGVTHDAPAFQFSMRFPHGP